MIELTQDERLVIGWMVDNTPPCKCDAEVGWKCQECFARETLRALLARDAESRGKVAVNPECLLYLKWSASREVNELQALLRRNPVMDPFKTNIVIENLTRAIAEAEAAINTTNQKGN